MSYTEKQLQEFNNISWWDLINPSLKALFEIWKEENNLADSDLDEMMNIISNNTIEE